MLSWSIMLSRCQTEPEAWLPRLVERMGNFISLHILVPSVTHTLTFSYHFLLNVYDADDKQLIISSLLWPISVSWNDKLKLQVLLVRRPRFKFYILNNKAIFFVRVSTKSATWIKYNFGKLSRSADDGIKLDQMLCWTQQQIYSL